MGPSKAAGMSFCKCNGCYALALSLCHVLTFFSVLPLCVPPVHFSVPYQTTLAVAIILMLSEYSFLLHWYCSPTMPPSYLGYAFLFQLAYSYLHCLTSCTFCTISPFLSCTCESDLVQSLQTLLLLSHYFTTL